MFSYLGRQKGARWEFYRVLTGAKLFLGQCEIHGSRDEEDQTSNPSDFQSHPYQAR